MEELGANFQPESKNPQNILQLRPIERFWANLHWKIHEISWIANSSDHFKHRIKAKIKKFDVADFKSLCRRDRSKIADASERTPLSVINWSYYQNSLIQAIYY